MIKRPSPGESEEDLLRMQEEYLKQKKEGSISQPAAQVTNIRKTQHNETNASKEKKQSKYAQAKGLSSVSNTSSRKCIGEIVEKNIEVANDDDNVYFPRVIPKLIGAIIEKNTEYIPVSQIMKTAPAEGFPKVSKRDPHIESGFQSVFALNNNLDTTPVNDDITDTITRTKLLNLPEKSYILSSQIAEEIHHENVAKLSQMSEHEILNEKQNLIEQLNPSIVEFLKAKRLKSTSNEHDGKNVKEQDIKQSCSKKSKNIDENITDDSNLWDNDVLSHPDVNNWLHFDSLEKDKLEWTKSISEVKKASNTDPYEARFDFKGYLLPYSLEYNEKNKALFHHGDEPHRPGYSLSELFELTRSSVIQQRVMALNTIAGILEYFSTGIYDNIVEIPLSKILFVIRFALDENIVVIIEPALKALRNLLYSRIDEAYLDSLFICTVGGIQPFLENDKIEIEELETKESELKDFHLAEIDLITALVRTDILQRIYYILNSVKPSFYSVQFALQILIRLARDSPAMSLKIADSGLLVCIIQHFLPITGLNFRFNTQIAYSGKPILPALKLLKILSKNSKEISSLLINEHSITKQLEAYISSGVDATYGMRIQIEAMHILEHLLSYGLGCDTFVTLIPVITTTLYKHVEGTDIYTTTSVLSCFHAAAVINLLNMFSRTKSMDAFANQINPLLRNGLIKWLNQITLAQDYNCGHLNPLISIFNYVSSKLVCDDSVALMKKLLVTFSKSNMMKKMFDNLLKSSNLLSSIDSKQIHRVRNLNNFGGAVVDSSHKILPVVNPLSPVTFFNALLILIQKIDCSDVSAIYVDHFKVYIQRLASNQLNLYENWFTNIEMELILNLLKIIVSVKGLSEEKKDIVFSLGNKLGYILRSYKSEELLFLFNEVIFNKNWFTSHRLMSSMNISDVSIFNTALNSIDEIKNCYINEINITARSLDNVVLKRWEEPILPRDWIYLPIVQLYSKNFEFENAPKVIGVHAEKVYRSRMENKESVIRCCLEWIIFNEICYPNTIQDIPLTDRFCRIMCVYLCDNSLFLDDRIKKLLSKCLSILFEKEKSEGFDFDKELSGIHNFQDFYTQFIEQFQGVSYGDSIFAACLMVPQAQKHNVKWRKLLWSEYAGTLRAIDCPENILCYKLEDYLYPEETDESLIKCYHQALSSNLVKVNTLPYTIAAHHLQCYKNRIAK